MRSATLLVVAAVALSVVGCRTNACTDTRGTHRAGSDPRTIVSIGPSATAHVWNYVQLWSELEPSLYHRVVIYGDDKSVLLLRDYVGPLEDQQVDVLCTEIEASVGMQIPSQNRRALVAALAQPPRR